jgi:hypothetical protein
MEELRFRPWSGAGWVVDGTVSVISSYARVGVAVSAGSLALYLYVSLPMCSSFAFHRITLSFYTYVELYVTSITLSATVSYLTALESTRHGPVCAPHERDSVDLWRELCG